MKRFYETASVLAADAGFGIALDGRPVRTPGRAPLAVPTAPLAEAIAGEWAAQGERIDPRAMPLTGLANAAIDRVAPDPAAFAAGLAAYGESDLLCYRAEGPESLARLQAEEWDPLLDWAARRYDVGFEVVTGIMHRAQPARTIARLGAAVAALDPFRLAGLSPLVTITGSLIAALALVEDAFDPDTVWRAATLDERWQAERWGEDAAARQALDARRADYDAAIRFAALSAAG